MSSDNRPPIPDPMQREVRQRCGFGCVFCGIPIYHYEHIIEYSKVREHRPENITLLCPTHHEEKTKGLRPVDQLREADANPWNLNAGASTAHTLHYRGSQASIEVGSNVNSAVQIPSAAIMVDGVVLLGFRFEGERCLLHIMLFNKFNEPILIVRDNELTYSVDVWDVTFVGHTLTIRAGSGDIFIEIEFYPPDRVVIPRGRILFNGVELEIRPDSLLIVNNAGLITNCGAHNCSVMLDLGSHPPGMGGGGAIRIAKIPRYGVDRK